MSLIHELHQAAKISQATDALDRLLVSYRLLLARKPVRDATETIAEAEAALQALQEF